MEKTGKPLTLFWPVVNSAPVLSAKSMSLVGVPPISFPGSPLHSDRSAEMRKEQTLKKINQVLGEPRTEGSSGNHCTFLFTQVSD